MKPYKIFAHIHSLNGEMKEAAILVKVGDNDYIAEYRGVKCHAVFNPFNCTYYLDDIYAIVREEKDNDETF